MYRKKHSNAFKYGIFVIIFALMCLSTCCVVSPISVNADTKYSDVLEDLQVDETFNAEQYPQVDNDYSLQVIQIAESADNELFIYVYQPSGKTKDLKASSINISTAINDSFSPKNYTLSFINSNGVFYKYKVNDFELLPDALRYYSIVSIFRPYDEAIDTSPDNDNTVDEVVYEVGKLFVANTVDGQVVYSCLETETILITDKYLGFIRYSNGWLPMNINYACDSHFVAFSTDKPIDKLIDAEVYYISRVGLGPDFSETTENGWHFEQPIENYVVLSDIDEVQFVSSGLGGGSYTWKRIEKVSDFIANEDLTEEAKQSLNGKDWVLRFAETHYQSDYIVPGQIQKTKVTEVTILKLKFETNGVVYNLGVVDNKQSGSIFPDNNMPEWLETFVKVVMGIIIGFILVVILIFTFPYILKFLIWLLKNLFIAIKYILLAVWYLIASPYYIIKYLINK